MFRLLKYRRCYAVRRDGAHTIRHNCMIQDDKIGMARACPAGLAAEPGDWFTALRALCIGKR
jgi:hypothetical protein